MVRKAGLPDTPSSDVIVMVCGSDGMMGHLSGKKNPDKSQGEVDPNSVLGKMGFTKENVFKF